MNNPLDLFAWKLRTERKRQHLTQKALAERLHMSIRTIIEIEKCKSNSKFETVALLAKELNISLDAAIFPDMVPCFIMDAVFMNRNRLFPAYICRWSRYVLWNLFRLW